VNRALQQLIHGAVIRVLDDNNVTDQAERDRQLARAVEETERTQRQVPTVVALCSGCGDVWLKGSDHIQHIINGMEAQAAGKSEDWKSGARAVIEALNSKEPT
jgi:hypothetical protein